MTNLEELQAIAMNLSRIGNWVADGYTERQKKITTFLNQTTALLNKLSTDNLPQNILNPLSKLIREYPSLENELKTGPKNASLLAEKLLTWGTILTHRTKNLTPGN